MKLLKLLLLFIWVWIVRVIFILLLAFLIYILTHHEKEEEKKKTGKLAKRPIFGAYSSIDKKEGCSTSYEQKEKIQKRKKL